MSRAIEGLRDAVQGCLGMAFRFLQVSKVLVLDADIVGVVGFHGLLGLIKSEQSGRGRCTRLGSAGHALPSNERPGLNTPVYPGSAGHARFVFSNWKSPLVFAEPRLTAIAVAMFGWLVALGWATFTLATFALARWSF
jgi:hypothetical protein